MTATTLVRRPTDRTPPMRPTLISQPPHPLISHTAAVPSELLASAAPSSTWLDGARDFLNTILGPPVTILYGPQEMAIDYAGVASFRTPIAGFEVTPAGWFFLICFLVSRYRIVDRIAGRIADATQDTEIE